MRLGDAELGSYLPLQPPLSELAKNCASVVLGQFRHPIGAPWRPGSAFWMSERSVAEPCCSALWMRVLAIARPARKEFWVSIIPVAPLSGHVAHVVGLGTNKEVCRVAADPVVAGVADAPPMVTGAAVELAVHELPGQPVGAVCTALRAEDAVAGRGSASRPRPAFGGSTDVHTGPEPCCGVLREHHGQYGISPSSFGSRWGAGTGSPRVTTTGRAGADGAP